MFCSSTRFFLLGSWWWRGGCRNGVLRQLLRGHRVRVFGFSRRTYRSRLVWVVLLLSLFGWRNQSLCRCVCGSKIEFCLEYIRDEATLQTLGSPTVCRGFHWGWKPCFAQSRCQRHKPYLVLSSSTSSCCWNVEDRRTDRALPDNHRIF